MFSIFFLLIPIGCICTDLSFSPIKTKECDAKNTKFIEDCGIFVKCVMDKNVDGSFCKECHEQYGNAKKSYMDLTQDQNCRAQYVTNNQLNLVEILYANTKHYWDLGVCSGETVFIQNLLLQLLFYSFHRLL